MPMERPTLAQLIDQGATEFEGRLPGVLARTRRGLVAVLNRVLAGGLSGLYKYAEFLNRQAWPDLAEAEQLDGHGGRWGIARTPAAAATGSVRFTGANGTAIPAGTTVQRADGVQYATTDAGAIAAGEAVIAVRAVVAGQASSAAANTALTLSAPLAGVNANAVATTDLAGGADVEDDEADRARILARVRKAPQGGSADDYIAWAKEVPGVTRVWLYPGEQGPGTVVVRFMRDDDVGGGIPSAGEVADVQAHLDALRPVTAQLFVVAPVAFPVNFTIQLTPNTAVVQAAVQAELADLIRREATPGGTLLLSHIREAISSAAGETDHVMPVPAANVVAPAGQIPTMGAIAWV